MLAFAGIIQRDREWGDFSPVALAPFVVVVVVVGIHFAFAVRRLIHWFVCC